MRIRRVQFPHLHVCPKMREHSSTQKKVMFGVPSLVSSCGSLATPLCIAGVLPKPKIGLFTDFLLKRQKMTDHLGH